MRPERDDPKNPDMSPEAVERRLRMVESLRRLCLSLKEAGTERSDPSLRDVPINNDSLVSIPNNQP
jgi:hypothetical protein